MVIVFIKLCLHLPLQQPSIVTIKVVTVTLTDRMGLEAILSVKGTVTKDTMLNLDDDFHGHELFNATYKRTFIFIFLSGQNVNLS